MADNSELTDLADISNITDKATLLAELAEVQVPSVSAWPAPGWWVLLTVLIVGVCAAVFVRHQRAKKIKNAWRKQALDELNTMQHRLSNATHTECHALVRQSSSLLRRVMLHVNGRSDTAALTDTAWLNVLQHYNRSQPLDEALLPLLVSVPYEPSVDDSVSEDSVGLLLSWMKSYIANLPQVSDNFRRAYRPEQPGVPK